MNKDFQNFESIYETAHRCLQAGIRPSFNIIFAYPGEGRKERRETVKFMMDVCRRYPGAEFWTNIFTPYPGSPVMNQAKELGIEVPNSLEGWADFFPRYTVLPWLKGKDHRRLQVMRDYLRIAFDRVPIAADTRGRVTKALQKAISYPARWRLDHDVYSFPAELWANEQLKRLNVAAKPAVDAKRLEAGHTSELPVKNKVVLFYPPYDGPPLGAPLCMLALASPLLQAGFQVKLVDNLTDPDFEAVILRETEDALCLGISLLTGPMIGSAIHVAKAVKKFAPTCRLCSVAGTPAWFPNRL